MTLSRSTKPVGSSSVETNLLLGLTKSEHGVMILTIPTYYDMRLENDGLVLIEI